VYYWGDLHLNGVTGHSGRSFCMASGTCVLAERGIYSVYFIGWNKNLSYVTIIEC
jgi:hypothetical protein